MSIAKHILTTIILSTVVNLVVGQDVALGTGERVIIDCGPLIDATEVAEPNVNWYHNENKLSSGSVLNVVISQDNRLCTITETVLDAGGKLGNGGNYACEVCHNMSTCRSNSTIIDVCGMKQLNIHLLLNVLYFYTQVNHTCYYHHLHQWCHHLLHL